MNTRPAISNQSINKQVANATLQLTLSNALARLLSLVTMPLLTRLLPPDAYGKAAIVGTLISLVSVVALSGMDMSYARAYHSKTPPFGQAVEMFAWRYALGAGFAAAGIGALSWWLVAADMLKAPAYLAGPLALGIFLSIANTMSQTRARLSNRYRSISASILISSIVSSATCIVIASTIRQDEMALVVSIIIGYLVPTIILGAPSYGAMCKSSGMNSIDRKHVIGIGLAGIVTAPMYWVVSSLDRWFLGYYVDAASVGIYSVGYSVATIGMMLNNALTSVWLPEAARAFENSQEDAKVQLGRLAEGLVAALAIVWLSITAAGGDAVRLLASPFFHDASTVVPAIAGAVFFHGILHLANAGLLLNNKLRYSVWWWLIGAAICVIMNIALIPKLGIFGASISQTASIAVISIGIFISSQRLYHVKLRSFRLLSVLFCVFVFGMIMQSAWSDIPWMSLLFKIPFGAAVALFVFLAIAPNAIRAILSNAINVIPFRNS
jgi:O-antigen/teichoic acid export membrane protein